MRSSQNQRIPKHKSSGKPELDGNWLLGEEPRASSRLWWNTVILLAILAATVWSWPYASRFYLQYQYVDRLQKSNNPVDIIESINNLAQLLPSSSQDLLVAFRKDDPESLRLAYRVLEEFLSQIENSQAESRVVVLQRLAIAMERSKESYSAEGKIFVSALATHVYHLSKDGTDLASIQTAKCSEKVLDDAGVKVLDRNVMGDLASKSGLQSVNPTLVDVPEETRPSTLPALTHNQVSGTEQPGGPNETWGAEATNDGFDQPVNVAPIPRPINVLREVSTIHEISPQETPRETSYSLTSESGKRELEDEGNQDSQPLEDSPIVGGMEQLDNGAVVKLLASVQEWKAKSAEKELLRRGMKEADLELAVKLARGDSATRIRCMHAMVESGRWDPIPWLTWMGEEGDRQVRFQAINLLGSIANDIASRELRYLLQRERDEEIAQQIQRVVDARLATSSTINVRGTRR